MYILMFSGIRLKTKQFRKMRLKSRNLDLRKNNAMSEKLQTWLSPLSKPLTLTPHLLLRFDQNNELNRLTKFGYRFN